MYIPHQHLQNTGLGFPMDACMGLASNSSFKMTCANDGTAIQHIYDDNSFCLGNPNRNVTNYCTGGRYDDCSVYCSHSKSCTNTAKLVGRTSNCSGDVTLRQSFLLDYCLIASNYSIKLVCNESGNSVIEYKYSSTNCSGNLIEIEPYSCSWSCGASTITESDRDQSTDTGMIIGVTIGSILGCCCFMCIFVYFCCCRNIKMANQYHNDTTKVVEINEVASVPSAPVVSSEPVQETGTTQQSTYTESTKIDVDVSKYMEWDHKMICEWIMTLDNGLYVQYRQVLEQSLSSKDKKGSELKDVDRWEIKDWGITTHEDKQKLYDHIQTLTATQEADGYKITYA